MLRKMLMLMEGVNENALRALLPKELQEDPSLKDFKDVGALAKSFIETKSLVGKSIRPPGPDAAPAAKKEFVDRMLQIEPSLIYAPAGDPESVARMMKKLGLPDDPKEYEVPEDAVKAGLDANDLRALAAKSRLTKSQFKDLVEVMATATTEQKRQAALERVALEQEWGEAREERTLAAHAAAMKMGYSEDEAKGLSPKQLKVFFNIAKAVGVNSQHFRQDGHKDDALSPSEALERMAEIRANPHYFDAYTNPSEHRRLTAKMSELGRYAYPE